MTEERACYPRLEEIKCDDYRWFEHDARGIPLCQVCENCKDTKLSQYRPEVLTNPRYETYGERIEELD